MRRICSGLALLAFVLPATAQDPGVRTRPADGLATAVDKNVVNWWYEPIFFPRGELALAGEDGSTQENYERFMTALSLWRIDPGTIVIAGKWWQGDGSAHPDPAKWPDMRGFIDKYQHRGHRVVVGVKLPLPEPEAIRALLSADRDCLNASGIMLEGASDRPVLDAIRAEAKRTKPDALLMMGAKEPSLAAAADMLVLNPAPEEAAIEAEVKNAAAAYPGKLLAWGLLPISGRAEWDEALPIQHRASRKGLKEMFARDPGVAVPDPMVVPILYFATRVGSGEKDAFGWKDYVTLRELKNSYRDKFMYSHPISIRRLKAQTASWSPLAPGQIIAQPFIQPIVSSGGYDTRGVKRAVVWLNNANMTGTFEVIDVTRNLQDPTRQTVCYSGKLQPAGTSIWGGNNLVADFTEFRQPGFYLLRLHLDQTIEVVDTTPFPIEDGLYFQRAAHAGHWYYYQRCGMKIPGWHEACHVNDGVLPDGTMVDYTGGWHDGGDYNKWSHYGWYGVISLLELAELERETSFKDPSALPSAVEEADWEGQFLLKSLTPEGHTLALFAPGPNPWVAIGRPEAEFMRMARVENGTSPVVGAWTAASLARLALFVPGMREKYAEAARKLYDIISERGMNLVDQYWGDRYGHLDIQSALLYADLAFVELGIDKERHEKEALVRMERVLAQQDPEGFFYSDKERTNKMFHPGYAMLPLYRLTLTPIPDEAKEKIVASFVRWAKYADAGLNLSPFGQMGTMDYGDGKWYLGPSANIGVNGPGWVLATTALLTGDRKYLEQAERQMAWELGCNPRGFSQMAGVGNNPRCFHHRMASIPEHSNGVLPGGILNGFCFARKGVPFQIGDLNTQNYVIGADLPTDYPVMDDDIFGWTWGYGSNEYWTPNTGYFLLMATQLERAVRKVK